MKQLFIGLLLFVAAVGFAQNGDKNFIDQNYIEVTGKAELEIIPDMIYLKIVLTDKENKEKLTLPEMEKKLFNKLTEINIDLNKDLSIKDFASNLKTYWLKSNVTLSKQYQLIIHDTKTLQRVFLELQKLEIANVSIEKSEHSKMEQYRKDVKVNAIKAARDKAELLAKSLNQNIGKALFIQETDYLNQQLLSNVLQGRVAGLGVNAKGYNSYDDTSNIEFEKLKVESSILVRFELR